MSPRPILVTACLFVLASTASISFAQSASGKEPVPVNPAAASQSTPVAEPEGDVDSADIPPFARNRISEEEYFALRDQEIRTRRGIDDLLRIPQARSQAVRRMDFQQRFLQLAPQGLLPFSALIQALAAPSWTPLGPAPIPNGQTSPSEVPVSGRVTAVAVDPTSDLIVYAGTAQGGVYRSTDGGSTWTALLDSAQSLAIGAITIDPLNHDTVFIGTGEGNLSGDSFFGVGIYIIRSASTASPVITGPFNSNGTSDIFTGRAITKILVNPTDDTKILVSTSSGVSGLSGDPFSVLPPRGVYLSTNAQTVTPTFAKQTVQTGAGGVQDRTVTDMIMDPANASSILVFVFGSANPGDGGLWVSTAGDPWAATATWTQAITRQGFGKFAVNRSGAGPTTTFMLAQDETVACGAAGNSAGTLKTSLDGVTWTAHPAANGFCSGQCFYDMVPAFHPDDANTIYLGGSADGLTGSCSSAAFTKSTNGGASFAPNDNLLHADSHALAFAPSNHNVIYVGNDGGIFRSNDAGVTWLSKNTAGFNATQFVSLSVHPTDENFSIGGTQDNGTEFLQPNGSWTRADFGDGGYSAIDQSSTDTTNVTMYHTYFNQTNNLIAVGRVTNTAAATEGNWPVFGCPAQPGLTANGINCADAVLFYAPIALGPGNPNTLYFGTDHLYRSADRAATMTSVSQSNFGCCDAQGRNFRVSAIGISPQDDHVRIVGLTNGHVFATTAGASPMTDVTGPWAASFVGRVAIDPNTRTTAYVTLDGYGTPSHVWKTTNLSGQPPTATWTNASSGLPDVPVNAFAIDPLNSNSLYAGTDIGVFASSDGGATWTPFGTGLPVVAVFDLNIQKTSRKVRIATHGRGAWEIAASAIGVNPDYSVIVSNGSATIPAGQTAAYTVSVVPQGGFSGTVSFTCSGLPTASNCTFSPSTVTASSSAASTTLTIGTTAQSTAALHPANGITLAMLTGLGFLGIVFFGTPSRRRRTVTSVCMLLMMSGTILMIASCGGSSTPPPPPPVIGTPAGSFSVTVNATSGATTHTSVITLVVQ